MWYRLGRLIGAITDIYSFVIFARVVFSWLPPQSRHNPVYGFIYRITEPVLRPIRKRLPAMQGIDLSPIIAIVVLYMIRYVIFGR
ncbi:MAG: YggT family protein [Planctomycetota bacterium]